MEKPKAELDELHARCDALDTCLQAVMGFVMWKHPDAAPHLKEYLRAQAAQAASEGAPYAQTELLVRFAESAASAEVVGLGNRT